MSLNSLASSYVSRDLAPKGRKTPVSTATDDSGLGAEDVQNALSALVEYVPTETITLYLAVISALPTLQSFVTGLLLGVCCHHANFVRSHLRGETKSSR